MPVPSQNTGSDRPGRFRALIVAPSGQGKTILGLSLDPAFPDVLPCPVPVALTRTRVIEIDGGTDHAGLDSAHAMGLNVDYWDLSNDTGKVLLDNLLEVANEAKKEVAAGKKDTVLFDSASVANSVLLTYRLGLLATSEGKGDIKNKWNVYDALLADNMRVFMALRAIPGNVIITMHEKYIAESDDEATIAKRKAEGQEGGKADLDVTGRIRSLYVNNSSYTLALKTAKLPGGKTDRWVTATAIDVACKDRSNKLSNHEPANLAAIVKKLHS